MNVKTLNEANNWDYWDAQSKQELDQGYQNTNVGERLVFENEQFRVWTIHLEVNQRLPFNTHTKPYFWTVLTHGKAQSYYADGSVIQSLYEIGDTQNYPDLSENNTFTHDLRNVGETTLIFTTTEYKEKI